MLCYRCGSHVPDSAESCATCGQKLAGGGVRQATATFSRRRLQGAQVDNAPFKLGDLVSNRYEIKDIVGAGPIGFVFRARDREVDVEVALKVINPRLVQSPEERKHFAKQIRLGRKLSHQNLIRVYEEGEDQDRPYFTMQLLEGLTLRKIIDLRTQRGGFFELREIEPIVAQIAGALDSTQKIGPHSNLKPDNVIVLPDLLRISDFGLALAIPHLPFVQAAKQRKAERYLSPEYLQGSEIDHRADIYALGVIVGEMLTGLTPDGAIPELARKNPEVPQQLEGLYRKALNSNPLARPKTAGEFFEEFAEITRRVSPPPLKRAEPPAVPTIPRSRPSAVPPPPPVAPVSGAPATVEVRRVRADKPPPPVPDLEPQEVPSNGGSLELLPPDATQPISESQLVIPPPPPSDTSETQLMPAVSAPMELIGEPTESRPIPREKGRAGVWFFALFTLAGLSLGAAGGYWLLGRIRQPQRPPIVQDTPKQDVVAPPGETPKQNDPSTVVAVAPTGPTGVVAASGAAGSTGPTGGTAAKSGRDAKAEAQRVAEEKRLAEERRRADEAARAASAKAEEESRRAAEEQRIAEEMRRAEEKRKAEAAARLAEEKRREAEEAAKKPNVVVASVTNDAKKAGGCPDGMKLIPGGSFRMGTARDDPMMGFDEKILSSTSVGAYCIDVYEYPNRRGSTPKVGVSWADAKRSCEAKGKRLCSEEEWEKACKGPGNARYPYGNTFDAEACNTEDELGEDRPLATAGRFQKCRSGYGIADMSGNAAEWTGSAYAGNADKAQKGGSFSKPDYAARCSARKNGSPSSRGGDVGFRCCADP